MGDPAVSVVMGVFNGAETLRPSIASVLGQTLEDIEFLVVDDGSTDPDVNRILDEISAADRRVRVLRKPHAGLTQALIAGCGAARGRYIARMDVGDNSLPDRLARQVQCAADHSDAALVTCGARFVAPGGEEVMQVIPDAAAITRSLRAGLPRGLLGVPGHGSAFFPRAKYEAAGGYRAAFYLAQDLDLWLRLVDLGPVAAVPEVLFQTDISPASLSGKGRSEQQRLTRLALESAHLRRRGLDDAHCLARAARIRPAPGGSARRRRANTLYFIGACLLRHDRAGAARYLREAVCLCPWHMKARVRLAQLRWGL